MVGIRFGGGPDEILTSCIITPPYQEELYRLQSPLHTIHGVAASKTAGLGEKGCFGVGHIGQKRCRAGTVWEIGGVHLHQRQPEIDGGD